MISYGRGMWRDLPVLRKSVAMAAFAVACGGCGAVEDVKQKVVDGGKREVSLKANYHIDREDNLFINDRYRVHLNVYHEEPAAITGKYIVRAYGDVFGAGGQENEGVGDNYDESPIATIPPGDAAAIHPFYYINDTALRGDDLSSDVAQKAVDMKIEVEFIPAPDDPKYRRTLRKFTASG